MIPEELLISLGKTRVPEEQTRRLIWAREVLVQALGEVKVGFGKSGAGGGVVGGEIAGLVEGVGREIGMLRSQSQMGA